MTNPVLKAVKERRNSYRFKSTSIDDQKIDMVLEAGRWAPSWTNTQPWRFILIKDKETKEKMSTAVSTVYSLGLKEAPVCIAVCVNPKKDSFHFIEDGSAATQNMALVAQSIGLSTSWIGVFSLPNEKKSSERKLKEILRVPKEWRIISILPLGVPRFKETKERKALSEIVDVDYFMTKPNFNSGIEAKQKSSVEIQRIHEPVSPRELEGALV